MTYFKWVSIILGSWMLIAGVWVALKPAPWKALALKICQEQRPGWVLWADLAWLAVVLFTWIELFSGANMFAFVVTLVMSLTLLKVIGGVFFWKKYREMVLALFDEPLALRTVMLSNAAIGLALIFLGFAA